MFSYQQNFFTLTKEVDREQFWALVDAPYTKELIDGVRRLKAEAAECLLQGDEAKAKELERNAALMKKRLPAFVFQAKCFDVTTSKSGKTQGPIRKQCAVRLNGLCVLDVDHVDNPREVFRMWSEQFTQPDGNRPWEETLGVLLVYVTPSGHGLKVVFKADAEKGNLIDNMNAMAKVLGVEADQSCKDASRLSFICTRDDILYINENELFTYEDKAFAEKYEPFYRNESPTKDKVITPLPTGGGAGGEAFYHDIPIPKIIDCWLDGKQPLPGDRHRMSLVLATELRYICDNDPRLVEAVLREVPFVKAIVEERNEDVAQTVKSAMDYKFYRTMPKRMAAALKKAGAEALPSSGEENEREATRKDLPLADWGRRIGELFESFPCMSEACGDMPPEGYPAALFVSAAFFGTLMTRTWYYFYHRPEEERRLNYSILIIGDPASGKSFATRLYKLLAAPIRTADQVGIDAINRYKREVKERTTSSKAQKGEALKKPQPVLRDHPSRTANGVFIADMVNAVEEVQYPTGDKENPTATKKMHLHLLTFDSELDNSTAMQKGGSWIDKQTMELKAFHNEEDGQCYANVDSVTGTFHVYWNYIYTGTPLSLNRKVTKQNFGSGLATRLAVIPLPPSGFKMMELKKASQRDFEAEAMLKQWAFNLDTVKGELPLWPLVEECWQWASERMAIAEVNDDKADEMLIKRVPYYGIAISAPYILMRHWQEWKEKATLTIDETDLKLCRLVLEIQYQAQIFYFSDYAESYFEDMQIAPARKHGSAFVAKFSMLPQEFDTEKAIEVFALSRRSVQAILSRMTKEGLITRTYKNRYKKK